MQSQGRFGHGSGVPSWPNASEHLALLYGTGPLSQDRDDRNLPDDSGWRGQPDRWELGAVAYRYPARTHGRFIPERGRGWREQLRAEPLPDPLRADLGEVDRVSVVVLEPCSLVGAHREYSILGFEARHVVLLENHSALSIGRHD